MITAVDTNVLLDILIPNARYARASKRMLEEALAQGALVISEVVHAELASQFPTMQELERFLADTQIRLVNSSPEALQRAGEAWKAYAKARGARLRCPSCGKEQSQMLSVWRGDRYSAAYLERFLSRRSCADAGGSAAHPRPRLLQDIP